MPIASPTSCPLEQRLDLFARDFCGVVHTGQGTLQHPQKMAGIPIHEAIGQRDVFQVSDLRGHKQSRTPRAKVGTTARTALYDPADRYLVLGLAQAHRDAEAGASSHRRLGGARPRPAGLGQGVGHHVARTPAQGRWDRGPTKHFFRS
jgi:hypothetical protein